MLDEIRRIDDELPALYRRAAVYVLPSVHETCYGRHVEISELLGLSVLDNVRVALLYGRQVGQRSAAELEREAEEILAFVHLDGSGERRAESLIPLERKRLELARALATLGQAVLADIIGNDDDVLAQLDSGEVRIVFDPETETANIVTARELREG